MLPYFKKAENQEHGADDFHGGDGPLYITDPTFKTELSDRFIKAAEELGLPRRTDFNGSDQEGAGYFQLTARNGKRCSTASAYLNPVKSRPNLTIITNAHTRKITFNGKHAQGVEVELENQIKSYTASREIILSAGTISSPQILMLSGIGPGETLQKFDI